jgi:hypothetical protein
MFEEILKAYGLGALLGEPEKIEIGHINDTYALMLDSEGQPKRYIQQRINRRVFKDIEGLINNIVYVTEHLREKLSAQGRDIRREAMHILRAKHGKYYYEGSDGGVYRIYDYIENSVCHVYAESVEQFKEAGLTYAKFQKLLNDIDVKRITDTIPDFHDTRKRYQRFLTSVEKNARGRVEEARELIEFVKAREGYSVIIIERINKGELPLRVTHNDTKINNVLFDDTSDKGLCVIDLDTIMKGSLLYDFGDAIRFGCNSAKEDEKDISKILFDVEKYNAYEDAYITELADIMTDTERELLPVAPFVMTYELVLRFLTDFIDGDVYFKTNYPEHNFYRARCQAKLLSEMEKWRSGVL